MLGYVAGVAARAEHALGRSELGAVLIGAGDEALRVLGARRHPGDVPEHERVVAAIREGLGDSRFEELRSEGALLTLDQVLSRILDGDVRIPGPVQKPVQIGVEKP